MYKNKIKLRIILLAGGRGTRLGSYTDKTPKPLLKVNNKEFLTYVINFLKVIISMSLLLQLIIEVIYLKSISIEKKSKI